MSDDKMNEAHAMTWQLADTLILKGANPLVVAAVMQTVSLSLYRTLLTEDEYNTMVDGISERRDLVKKFGQETKTAFH
jgi:hypothetical protein